MKTVILLCAIAFMFNFMTIVGHDNVDEHVDERLLNRYTETITREIVHRGASQIEMNKVRELWREEELGNIPLRKQVGTSCGTVALAMYMDYLGHEYRSQNGKGKEHFWFFLALFLRNYFKIIGYQGFQFVGVVFKIV